MLLVKLQSILELSGCDQRVGVRQKCANIIVNREQLRCQVPRLGQASRLQVGLQQSSQPVGMTIEVGNLLQTLHRRRHITRVEGVATSQQQRVAVAGIERDHALQNFFRRTKLAFRAQGLGCGGEDLPGLGLFA